MSESKAGARKSRLAVDAITTRKGARLLTRIDAPAKLLLAAAGEARRQGLLLWVEEEPRAPGPLPQHRERAWGHLSLQSQASNGSQTENAFWKACERGAGRGANAYNFEQSVSDLYRNLELGLGDQHRRDR